MTTIKGLRKNPIFANCDIFNSIKNIHVVCVGVLGAFPNSILQVRRSVDPAKPVGNC